MAKGVLVGGALLLLFTAMPVRGGVNADGAIIVHTNDAYTYSSASVCTTPFAQPSTCGSAITRTDLSASVVWLLAAFPSQASPRVGTIYYGISFDAGHLNPGVAYGPCSSSSVTESPDAGWPSNTDGNIISFSPAISGSVLFPFYHFHVVESLGSAGPYLCSAINPVYGFASFYTDGFPQIPDAIARFGCVKWYDQGSNDCPPSTATGACCNPITGGCAITTQASCASPGVWHSEWTECAPVNPCPQPQGACCVPDTGICTFVTESECLAPSVWHGEWTCSPNECPATPSGACCDPEDGSCAYTYERDCLAPLIWHGEWTCSPNNCPVPEPVGACCDPGGACTLTEQAACVAPSIWQAEWTSCEPVNPCPQAQGACCEPDTGVCSYVVEADCAAPSVWHGEWTCSTNNCPVTPLGACCDLVNGDCTYTYERDCPLASGWYGEWTCSPNNCPSVPASPTSWGRIKVDYR